MAPTKVDKEKVIKDILANKTYSEIAREYGVRPSTIGYYGQKLGIVKLIRTSRNRQTWKIPKIDKFLISKKSTIRRNFVSITNVLIPVEWKCTLCNHTWFESFDGIRKRLNLKGCSNCYYDPYTVFHDLLETINPLSSYFIGAFIAKGLTGAHNTITFNSPNKSKLEKFANLISCTSPIKKHQCKSKSKISYSLSFHSQKIIDRLKQLNVNKTSIPSVIPNEYAHDFIRGYFDFKGYVEYLDEETSKIRTNLSGNPAIIQQLFNTYKKLNPNAKGYTSRKRGIAEFHVNGTMSNLHFLSWLYNTNVSTLKYVDNNKYNAYLFVKNIVSIKNTIEQHHKEDKTTTAKNLQIIKKLLKQKRKAKRASGFKGPLKGQNLFLNEILPPEILHNRRQQPFFKEVLAQLRKESK